VGPALSGSAQQGLKASSCGRVLTGADEDDAKIGALNLQSQKEGMDSDRFLRAVEDDVASPVGTLRRPRRYRCFNLCSVIDGRGAVGRAASDVTIPVVVWLQSL